jgi:hypothetical protein
MLKSWPAEGPELLWQVKDLDSGFGALSIASGRIYVTSNKGDVIWKCAVPEGDAAGYASIIITEVSGIKQYVVYTAGGLIGAEAKSGKSLWCYDIKDRSAQVK